MYHVTVLQIDDRNNFQGATVRIFVFDYMSGGGFLGRPLPLESLQENELVVHALLADLAALDGIEIVTLRDARLPPLDLPVTVRTLYHSRELVGQLRRAMQECDAVWPIAPENNGELERFSRAVLEHRRTLIGSAPDAVALTAGRLATCRLLSARGVAVVPTWSGAEVHAGAILPEPPWVVKSDDGRSDEGACIVRGYGELQAVLSERGTSASVLVQPYLSGIHASLSVIIGNGGCRLLSCNRHRMVVVNDAFRLAGCVVNDLQSDRVAMEALAREVAAALPGLRGYFGVDLVVTSAGARVLAVHPRLTTAYAGLSRALGVNTAEVVLQSLLEGAASRHVQSTSQEVALDLEAMYVA